MNIPSMELRKFHTLNSDSKLWGEVPAAKNYFKRSEPITKEILAIEDPDIKLGTAKLLCSLNGLEVVTIGDDMFLSTMVRSYWAVFAAGDMAFIIVDMAEDNSDAE